MPQFRVIPVVMLVCSAGVAALAAQESDILGRLDLTTADAQQFVFAGMTTASLRLPAGGSAFKAAPADQRAALVRGAIAFARAYAATADFASRYAQFREDQRPQPPALARTGEEAQAAQLEQLERAIKQAQERAAELPPEARDELAHNVEYIRKQLAELNADPDHRAAVDAAVRDEARAADAEYRTRVREFEREYPSDASELVAQRLRSFLDLSATVDFTAKVERRADKKLHFVDAALEARPAEWKLLFRAGKPAVDAARSAAQEWLKALGG